MVYPRTKVLQRRRDVTSLLVRGIQPWEIAEILSEKRETIYNDVRVIRSGKYDALIAHTRDEIIAQLYLNAQERVRSLWRIVDNEQKGYVKVIAIRELRVNDERVISKLTAMREPKEARKDEMEKKEMDVQLGYYKDQFEAFKQRVESLQKRRLGWDALLKERLAPGEYEKLEPLISPFPGRPSAQGG